MSQTSGSRRCVAEVSDFLKQYTVSTDRESRKFQTVKMSAPSSKIFQVYLILKLKALRYFETSGPTKPTWRNVPEDLQIQHM